MGKALSGELSCPCDTQVLLFSEERECTNINVKVINRCMLIETNVVTPHLDEMVQMRGHNIRFYAELAKIN